MSPTLHVTSGPPTPNGTPTSPTPHVPLMSPPDLHVTPMSPDPHVPLMSPSPPSSPQMPTRSVSWATTEGSWATMEGSGATMRVAQATTEGSWATMEGSQATMEGGQAITRWPWATMEGPRATTRWSWATTRWARATTRWARATMGWASSAVGWARSAAGRVRDRWDPLATAWTLALLFGLPQVAIFGQREVGAGEEDCWATFIQPWGARAYVTWVALAVLVAPAALLGGLQVAVTRALGAGGHRRGLGRARAKSHRMAMVVLGVYVACWAPFFCAQLWAVWDPWAPVEGPAFTILMLLASLNSCTNPWIYAAFSTSLSRAMARILCPCRHRAAHA
ncbi:PREDICTED: vasopressin V2 receptor-like [Calidris pugnax]|uniref:vasopressin V2 receptor-like n=1 Tax=Calidris pugnax TaxID=198806 RepID=UPI00071C5A52|nr:PREDICTED: vasopressin V2 receptor-like [Calidris pugnax]